MARPAILPDSDIERQLAAMPGWTLIDDVKPGEATGTRKALHRSLKFRSFEQAMGFMNAAVPHIGAVDHHPSWENVYSTVTIRLSTGEAGHMVTARDIDLARYLEALSARWL